MTKDSKHVRWVHLPDVTPVETRYSAQARKSRKVFFFFVVFPLGSYHSYPMSAPPLTCAIAKTTPLSTTDKRDVENDAGIDAPYEPYP